MPKRKEYLYQLSDISELSHITECISLIIEKVIIDIGANRISAVVSDNASNVRKAREISFQILKMSGVLHTASI